MTGFLPLGTARIADRSGPGTAPAVAHKPHSDLTPRSSHLGLRADRGSRGGLPGPGLSPLYGWLRRSHRSLSAQDLVYGTRALTLRGEERMRTSSLVELYHRPGH